MLRSRSAISSIRFASSKAPDAGTQKLQRAVSPTKKSTLKTFEIFRYNPDVPGSKPTLQVNYLKCF